jgi:hypothetical protein
VANFDLIRETVASLDVQEIYVPAGRGYIGLVLAGSGPIVSVHSGYLWNLRNEDGGLYGLALPINRLRDGNDTNRNRLDGGECPECGILMPLAGICECW